MVLFCFIHLCINSHLRSYLFLCFINSFLDLFIYSHIYCYYVQSKGNEYGNKWLNKYISKLKQKDWFISYLFYYLYIYSWFLQFPLYFCSSAHQCRGSGPVLSTVNKTVTVFFCRLSRSTRILHTPAAGDVSGRHWVQMDSAVHWL